MASSGMTTVAVGVTLMLFTTDLTPFTSRAASSALDLQVSSGHSPVSVTMPSFAVAVSVDNWGLVFALSLKPLSILLSLSPQESRQKERTEKIHDCRSTFFILLILVKQIFHCLI